MAPTPDNARRLSWAARRGLGGLGAVSRLRWAGLSGKQLGAIAWALHSQKSGLEARAVLALSLAPQDALEAARESLTPRHFLTAAYAVAVLVLLDPDTPPEKLERVRTDLAARPHLPPWPDPDAWRSELAWCVSELVARRTRWDERREEQIGARRARRDARAAPDARRVSRGALRAYMKHLRDGTELSAAALAELHEHSILPDPGQEAAGDGSP